MGKAAAVIVALYFVVIAVLTVPVIAVCFYGDGPSFSEIFEVFVAWPYWLWLIVMLLCQAALLFIPLRISRKKPISRRSIWIPTIAVGFLLGCMLLGIILSVAEFIQHDNMLNESWQGWGVLAVSIFMWMVWAIVFYRYTKTFQPERIIELHCSWLFRSSLVGLLVAIPTHIIARHRDYCCAGFGTFVGIAFGIPIMLISFGPGIYFLYVSRWRRLHPQEHDEPDNGIEKDDNT